MRERDIPALPDNFTVWYHYCAGTYPDLKRTVDILIDNGQEFTPSVSANLFERFFTHDAEAKSVQSATTKLEGVIKRASEYLNEAGEGSPSSASNWPMPPEPWKTQPRTIGRVT